MNMSTSYSFCIHKLASSDILFCASYSFSAINVYVCKICGCEYIGGAMRIAVGAGDLIFLLRYNVGWRYVGDVKVSCANKRSANV